MEVQAGTVCLNAQAVFDDAGMWVFLQHEAVKQGWEKLAAFLRPSKPEQAAKILKKITSGRTIFMPVLKLIESVNAVSMSDADVGIKAATLQSLAREDRSCE